MESTEQAIADSVRAREISIEASRAPFRRY